MKREGEGTAKRDCKVSSPRLEDWRVGGEGRQREGVGLDRVGSGMQVYGHMCCRAAAKPNTTAFAWRRGPPTLGLRQLLTLRLHCLSLQVWDPEQDPVGERYVRREGILAQG